MARRTLATTWRNIERLVDQHYRRPDNKKLDDLNQLLVKVNDSNVAEALATLFVNPHQSLENCRVRFAPVKDDHDPDWKTSFAPEEQCLYVNVLGVFEFQRECEEARTKLTTPEARKSFYLYRYLAFLAELGKLPARLTLFLLILNEVANIRDISRVDKRGGEVELAEGRNYLQMLWAFKELESFMQHNKGLDLRSEYAILWLESDWFVGR